MKLPRQRRYLIAGVTALAIASCVPHGGEFGGGSPAIPSSIKLTKAQSAVAGPYVYIADRLTGVGVYSADGFDRGPIRTIQRGVLIPAGIFIDRNGTLYVANGAETGHDTVTSYAKGKSVPLRTYRGMVFAVNVVAGDDGVVYVADADGQRVIEFSPGTTKRLRVLHPGGVPISVALDARNNLYVGYMAHTSSSSESQIKRYAPGASVGVDILLPKTVYAIGEIRFDRNGAMLVANQFPPGIDVFVGERQPPIREIVTGQSLPYGITFSAAMDRIYVTAPFNGSERPKGAVPAHGFGPKLPNTVVALSYPGGRVEHLWRQSYWIPTGVATSASP